MLREVEPQYHHFYQSRIRDLMGLLKKHQRLDLSDEEQAKCTFLIADNKEWGVYGGAVLFRKKLRTLRQRKWEASSSFIFQAEKTYPRALDPLVWTCAVVLHLKSKIPPLPSEEVESFYRDFYQELSQKFLEFGTKEKTHCLCLTLDLESYLSLEHLGLFQFFSKFEPHETKDGLFHGLLLLMKDSFKFSNRNRDFTNCPLQQRRIA